MANLLNLGCCDECECVCGSTEFCSIDLTITPSTQYGISFNRSLVPTVTPGNFKQPTFTPTGTGYCKAEWNWQSAYGTTLSKTGRIWVKQAAGICSQCPSVCYTVDYEFQHRLYCVQKYYIQTRCVSGGLIEVNHRYEYAWKFQERILATISQQNYVTNSAGLCVTSGGSATSSCDSDWIEPVLTDPLNSFDSRLLTLNSGYFTYQETLNTTQCANLLLPKSLVAGSYTGPETYIEYWPGLILSNCGLTGTIHSPLPTGIVNGCFRVTGLVTSCTFPNPAWYVADFRTSISLTPISAVTSDMVPC